MADDLEFRLTWTADIDMDLYVYDPNNFEIYYGSGPSPEGGDLTSGDQATAGTEIVSWPPGQTPAGDNFSVKCRYTNWGAAFVDAVFTLEVYRGGVLYQEESGTITTADYNVGARLDYREYLLCSNVESPAHAVGRIEMGGQPGGESCLVPNDPADPCYSYGWNWAGNIASSFSSSGLGPGDYSPSGTSSQTIAGVSVVPPADVWGCEGYDLYTVVMNSISGAYQACIDAVVAMGAWTPGEGNRIQNASFGLRHGGLRVQINLEYEVDSLNIGLTNWDVNEQVSVGVCWGFGFGGTPSAAVVDFVLSTNVMGGNPMGNEYGGLGAAGGANGDVYTWGFGVGASLVADNLYSVNPSTGASTSGTTGAAIGDFLASHRVDQGLG